MEGLEGGADYLADERKKTQFDVDAMKILWAGGKRDFEIADRMARLVASDPVITFPLPFCCFLWRFGSFNFGIIIREQLHRCAFEKRFFSCFRTIEFGSAFR